MSFRSPSVKIMLISFVILNLFIGCSRDSNTKPQLHSYPQAVLWYQNQNNLDHIYAESSAIYHAAYHESDHVLLIYFTSDQNKGYIFGDVPKSVWLEFKNAPSKGQYYNDNIKGRYKFEF